MKNNLNKLELHVWDSSKYLKTNEDIKEYLNAAV